MDRVTLIKDEMNKRYRISLVCVFVAAVVFLGSFGLAVLAYVAGRNNSDVPETPKNNSRVPETPPLPKLPALRVVHVRATSDKKGFPVVQFSLRNNSQESQIIVRVDVELVWYVVTGGGSRITTRPLEPLAVWDLTLPTDGWIEKLDVEKGNQHLEHSLLFATVKEMGSRKRFRGWQEITLKPPAPLLIAADDAATICIRIAAPKVRPWPGPFFVIV